ncbi:MAG TPA: N-acetylglucosamine-6-phosphate deacetylase [Erysipelotrichaceae bacterium]|nr:MAG: N-acetylglucosamine-6-phosphate deacetylase [Firmicutes bacterium GWE2_51_13]HAM64113.1 N-acetylglucosamine-6-phosphate deacetylase [Erysipelotrichaceae bacterium]HBZ41766.1 N-acetylglucosamine-6-phosphate deacetylase [Erysipelotrichaceae bacterium]
MKIQSKRIWIAGQFIPAMIEIEGTKIKSISPYLEGGADLDVGDARIIPGMIDVHTHGAFGFDTNDATEEGLRLFAKGITEEGITSFLPTTVTQGEDVLTKALKNVAKVVEEGYTGAEILGVHFEGPYLNMKFKGAQPPEFIVNPDVEQFKRYQKAAKGLIKYMTMSTETDPGFELTHYASQHGVTISIGHSGATYDEALMGIANGATSMTHVFNGMSAFNHREPGLVGAALRVREVYGEIIPDGNHVVWPAINNFMTAKGKDHVLMITDSLCMKGHGPGEYFLGGHQIEIKTNGSAYLYGTNTLAGSTLRFNRGLQNLIEKAYVPLDAAINACTINPARALRVDDQKGKIVAGYDADLVVLADNYDVLETFVRGQAQLKKAFQG